VCVCVCVCVCACAHACVHARASSMCLRAPMLSMCVGARVCCVRARVSCSGTAAQVVKCMDKCKSHIVYTEAKASPGRSCHMHEMRHKWACAYIHGPVHTYMGLCIHTWACAYIHGPVSGIHGPASG